MFPQWGTGGGTGGPGGPALPGGRDSDSVEKPNRPSGGEAAETAAEADPNCTHCAPPGYGQQRADPDPAGPIDAAYVGGDAAPTVMTTTGAGATQQRGRLYGAFTRKTNSRARFTGIRDKGFGTDC